MSLEPTYTRRELAEMTGVGFDAIRFYENRGVLNKPIRGPNNYRLYGEDTVQRVRFLKLAKRCGFSLKEITQTLGLIESSDQCEVDTDAVIDEKIAEVQSRIVELNDLQTFLSAAKTALKGKDCENLNSYLDLAP